MSSRRMWHLERNLWQDILPKYGHSCFALLVIKYGCASILFFFFSHGFRMQVLFLNPHWNKYVNLWKIFSYMPLKLCLEPPVIVMPHSGKHYHRELLEVPWGGRMRPLFVEQGSSVSQVSCLLLFIILWTPDLPAYWILSFLAGNTLVAPSSLLDRRVNALT